MANSSVMVVGHCTTNLKDLTAMICNALPEVNDQWRNFTYDPRTDQLAVNFRYRNADGRAEDRTLTIYLSELDHEYENDGVPIGPKVAFHLNSWGSSVVLIERLAAEFSKVYGNIFIALDDGGGFHRYDGKQIAA